MRVEQKPEPTSTAGKEKKIEKFVPKQPMSKIVILASLVIASTALFWLAWHNAVVTGISFDTGTQNIMVIVTTLLAFCLMLCFLAVAEVLITKKVIVLMMSVVAAGTVFIFFHFSTWSFVGFILVVLSYLYWSREVRIDTETRTKFIPQRVVKSGLRATVSLILLAVSFVYYGFLTVDAVAENNMTERFTDMGTNAITQVLDVYYKERFDPMMTIDEFIEQIGFGTLEEVRLDTGYEEIDAAIEEGMAGAKDEAIDVAREEFLNSFDIEATGDESMETVIGRFVSGYIDEYAEPYMKFIPALMAIGLYFVLHFFGFIYRELIKSMSFLVFHILVWLKFIKVEKIKVEAEKITL